MKTYIITSTLFEGELQYTYNSQGLLCGFKAQGDIAENQGKLHKVVQNLPLTYAALEDIVAARRKNGTLLSFTELVEDSSFDRFYADYGYKRNKTEAQKAYAKLTEAERTQAIMYIPQYKNRVKRDGVAMLYPASYLGRKPWAD